MKKLLIIILVAVLLIVVGFSGCNEIKYFTKEEIIPETLEMKIHNLVNKERLSYGLQPLEYDSQLALIARRHSEDMVKRNYYDHYTPEGVGPTERAIQAGYSVHKEGGGGWYTDGIAENIAITPVGDVIGCGDVYSMDEIAECAVSGWMTSWGHRENILNDNYDKEGIGIYVSSNDEVYITQDFW